MIVHFANAWLRAADNGTIQTTQKYGGFMTVLTHINKALAVLGCLLFISGCTSMFDKHVEWETVEPDEYPVLTAVGAGEMVITVLRGLTTLVGLA